jgi:hypothetical protein
MPFKIVLLFGALALVRGASAQTALDVQQIADTMIRLCLAGGHTQAESGGGTGKADISLRSLDVKGNLTGEFKVSRSSVEGLVNGIDNALTQVAADQADKVRACLQPVRERVLDVLLPQKGGENSTPATLNGIWRGVSNNSAVTVSLHVEDRQATSCRSVSGTMTDNSGGSSATILSGSFCPDNGTVAFRRELNGVVCQNYAGGVSKSRIEGTFTVAADCGGSKGTYPFWLTN